MGTVIIKPRSGLFHGHHWVYSSEVKRVVGEAEPGGVVSLQDERGRPLGTAIYNPASQIVARRFSRRRQRLDLDLFRRRIARAARWRDERGGIDPKLCRVVWSEADGLPGVVVDRYGDAVVFQTLTLAMDQRKELLVEALVEELGVGVVVERNDVSQRKAEGMDADEVRVWSGEVTGPVRVMAGEIPLRADLLAGQKTGLYLDQLGNYSAVGGLAAGRRVLDMFCNQGGFALACAAGGAREVVGVDSSAGALALGRENAVLLGEAGGRVSWVEANAFDHLRVLERVQPEIENKDQDGGEEGGKGVGAGYDLIVLDPPSFTRNKKSLAGALRGYKEIHLRALKLLRPGGLLCTFSCSHHMGWGELQGMVADASVDARRTVRVRQRLIQPADHPIDLCVPETEYLRGLVLEVVASW